MAINLEKGNKKVPGGDVPAAQEKVRGKLAIGLLLLFSLLTLGSSGYALFGNLTPDKSDFIKYVISGLVGMLGVVIGFYYGQNTK